MPYISDEDRKRILECEASPHLGGVDIIEALIDTLRTIPSGKTKGACNYVISRLVAGAMKPDDGWSYTSLSNAAGVFDDAGNEFRRRLLDPYEDKAIEKNGDLPEYK